MGEIKLKPCPFCGGEVRLFEGVHCSWIDCECGIKTQVFKTKEQAIEAWNTRKPMEQIVEQLETMNEQGIKFNSISKPLMEIDHAIKIMKAGGVDV